MSAPIQEYAKSDDSMPPKVTHEVVNTYVQRGGKPKLIKKTVQRKRSIIYVAIDQGTNGEDNAQLDGTQLKDDGAQTDVANAVSEHDWKLT